MNCIHEKWYQFITHEYYGTERGCLKVASNRNENMNDMQSMRDECKRSMYYHIILTMTDGSMFDGIIENVDTDNVTMLVGEDTMEKENENEVTQQTQYGGYHRPRRRFRRFRRRRFPLNLIAELFHVPYPYFTSQNPYYNPYQPY